MPAVIPMIWSFLRTLPTRFPDDANAPTLYDFDKNSYISRSNERIPSEAEPREIAENNRKRRKMNGADQQLLDEMTISIFNGMNDIQVRRT